MPLDPVSTLHPLTGAIRPVTSTLLAETYLCPLPAPFEDADAIREAKHAPWSASLTAAPEPLRMATPMHIQSVTVARRAHWSF